MKDKRVEGIEGLIQCNCMLCCNYVHVIFSGNVVVKDLM